eukprot:4984609-Amphidinium_carterae.1
MSNILIWSTCNILLACAVEATEQKDTNFNGTSQSWATQLFHKSRRMHASSWLARFGKQLGCNMDESSFREEETFTFSSYGSQRQTAPETSTIRGR